MRRPSALPLALALLVPVAARAGDNLTAKEAVSQFKAAAKDQLKLLKGAIKLEHEEFLLAMEDIEANYESEQITWQLAVAQTFQAVNALQLALQAEQADAVYSLLVGDGVAALAGLGLGAEAWPLELYFGQGGTLDDVLADFRGAVAKELVSADKRLKKTAKLLDKQDDVVLLHRLLAADKNDHYCVNDDGSFTWGAQALAVHTLLSASARTAANDGIICLGGLGYNGDVDLSFGGPASFTDQVTIDGDTDSWAFQSDPDIAEGNYVISAGISADTSSVVVNFGVP